MTYKAKIVDLSLLSKVENEKILKLYHLFKKEEKSEYIKKIDTLIKNKFKVSTIQIKKAEIYKTEKNQKTNAQQTVLQESGESDSSKFFY